MPKLTLRDLFWSVLLTAITAFVIRDMGPTALGMLFGGVAGQWAAYAVCSSWRLGGLAIGMIVGTLVGAGIGAP